MKAPEVIFCDNHLLLLDKPPGLPTQAEGGLKSLESWGREWVKKRFNKPGSVFLHAIHRLDKPVSGLVLFARTSKALLRLNEAVRERRVKKTYLARIEGVMENPSGELIHYLLHGDHKASLCSPENPEGKKAILTYRVLEESPSESLVEIDLDTGRYHQIRIQFSAIGHPILGDAKYSSRVKYREGAIALLHKKLQFSHPVSKENLIYYSKNII
jgi:23S rRNA pseudouridine1911/1915/1917 synthase